MEANLPILLAKGGERYRLYGDSRYSLKGFYMIFVGGAKVISAQKMFNTAVFDIIVTIK